MSRVNCFWFLLVLVSLVESKQICEFEDTVCMTKAAKNAFNTVIAGIEGLLEPTDTLHIQEINGKIAPGFKYVLRNATMLGIKDCNVTELRANRETLLFDFGLRCPKQIIKYDFIAKGDLGAVAVDNKGQIEATLDEYLITVKGKYGSFVSEKDNDLRMYLESYNVDIESKGQDTFKFNNPVDGEINNSDLHVAYMERKNVKRIEKNLRTSVIEAFMRVFMEKVNTYFKAYPVVYLITV